MISTGEDFDKVDARLTEEETEFTRKSLPLLTGFAPGVGLSTDSLPLEPFASSFRPVLQLLSSMVQPLNSRHSHATADSARLCPSSGVLVRSCAKGE